MRSIIREFYLGNLSPDATAIRQTSELKKAVQADGFRTGAKFMLDILTGESVELAPLVKIEP